MSDIYTPAFWKDAGERVASSALLTGLAVLGGDALDVFHADWGVVGVAVVNVAVLTLFKALVASNLGAKGTAGFTTATIPVSPTGAIGEFQQGTGAGVVGDTVPADVDTDNGGRHRLDQ